MTYILAKYLHLLGLTGWLGVIPLELYAYYQLHRTRLNQERYRLLHLMNGIRLRKECPAILSAAVGGIWLVNQLGLNDLLLQPWFRLKLFLLALLIVIEGVLTCSSMSQERRCRERLAQRDRCAGAPDGRASMLLELGAAAAGFCILWISAFKILPLAGSAAVFAASALALGREMRHLLLFRSISI